MKHINIEELLIDYLEGKLNPEQMKKAESILASNEEYADMIGAWSQIKVEPDTSVVYANKEALKQKNIIAFTNWNRLAVAASLLLAVSCSLWVWNNDKNNDAGNAIAGVQEINEVKSNESDVVQNTNSTSLNPSSNMLSELLGSANTNSEGATNSIANQEDILTKTVNNSEAFTSVIAKFDTPNENGIQSIAHLEKPMAKISSIQSSVKNEQATESLNFATIEPKVRFRNNTIATLENSLFSDAYSGVRGEVIDKLKELQPSNIKNSLRNSSFFSEFRDALVPTSLEETLAMNK